VRPGVKAGAAKETGDLHDRRALKQLITGTADNSRTPAIDGRSRAKNRGNTQVEYNSYVTWITMKVKVR